MRSGVSTRGLEGVDDRLGSVRQRRCLGGRLARGQRWRGYACGAPAGSAPRRCPVPGVLWEGWLPCKQRRRRRGQEGGALGGGGATWGEAWGEERIGEGGWLVRRRSDPPCVCETCAGGGRGRRCRRAGGRPWLRALVSVNQLQSTVWSGDRLLRGGAHTRRPRGGAALAGPLTAERLIVASIS